MTATARRVAYGNTSSPESRALAVTLADVLKHLRVTSDEENDLIRSYIVAATDWCETYQGQRYIIGEVTDYWTAFPCREIYLRWSPISDSYTTSTTLSYYDSDGDATELAYGTGFYMVGMASPPYLYPPPTGAWPATQPNREDAVQVSYFPGVSTLEGGAPIAAKQAIKMLVGHWYRNRETVLTGTISKEIEFSVKNLLGPKRLIPVA